MTIAVVVKATGHEAYVFEGDSEVGNEPTATVVPAGTEQTFNVYNNRVLVVSEKDMRNAPEG